MESQNRVKGLLEDLIKQLTDGERDSLKNNSGNLSLSDTGHLRRQLLSLQHAMEVTHTHTLTHTYTHMHTQQSIYRKQDKLNGLTYLTD